MARARVAVLISGTGTNMAALVYAAKHPDCPFEIVLVASNNPDAPGLKLAAAEGIETFAYPHKGLTRAAHDAIIHDALTGVDAGFVALAGYMRILTPDFVAKWEGRMLNIHPSLLPKYKGLHTHAAALTAGDSHAGCSVHLVTAELDDGPVLSQTPVAILPGDTEDSLAARVLIAEHQLYSRCLADHIAAATGPEALLARVRSIAMALPEADEIVSHGMPCFGIIKGKKFAYFTNDHHGDGKVALLVKIGGVEEQAMLIDGDPDRYYRPAYFGDGWIGIRLDLGDTDWDNIGERMARSWQAIAPKRLVGLRDIADQF
ncbi:MAG: phosphoribosylglycinamide formyltransferase [Sphingomonadales bacterium]